MWQRFTERARKVVFYAQDDAQKYGDEYVSTEHLLLGLLRESDSVAGRTLRGLDISLQEIREKVLVQMPKGDARPNQDMTLTPRGKRVIDLAYDEARQIDNNYIGTEHLLLGLIRERDGLAGRVLNELGIRLEEARRIVRGLQLEDVSKKDLQIFEKWRKLFPQTKSARNIKELVAAIVELSSETESTQPEYGQDFKELWTKVQRLKDETFMPDPNKHAVIIWPVGEPRDALQLVLRAAGFAIAFCGSTNEVIFDDLLESLSSRDGILFIAAWQEVQTDSDPSFDSTNELLGLLIGNTAPNENDYLIAFLRDFSSLPKQVENSEEIGCVGIFNEGISQDQACVEIVNSFDDTNQSISIDSVLNQKRSSTTVSMERLVSDELRSLNLHVSLVQDHRLGYMHGKMSGSDLSSYQFAWFAALPLYAYEFHFVRGCGGKLDYVLPDGPGQIDLRDSILVLNPSSPSRLSIIGLTGFANLRKVSIVKHKSVRKTISNDGKYLYSWNAEMAIEAAELEASREGNGQMGPHHLLLGLIANADNHASVVFKHFNITEDILRRAIKSRTSVPVTYPHETRTSQLNRIFRFADEEIESLGHNIVGTMELLAGLIRCSESIAGQVLEEFGFSLEQVRDMILLDQRNFLEWKDFCLDAVRANEVSELVAAIPALSQERIDDVPPIENSIVKILVGRPNETRHYGTGFLISENLYFATAWHVIADASSEELWVEYRDSQVSPAQVSAVDLENDLAIIQATTKPKLKLVHLQIFGEKNYERFYDPHITVCGSNPFHRVNGLISSFKENEGYEIDVAIDPGSSGAPVMASDEVIAIVQRRVTRDNMVRAVFAKHLADLAKSIGIEVQTKQLELHEPPAVENLTIKQFEGAKISDLSWAPDGARVYGAAGVQIVHVGIDPAIFHASNGPQNNSITAVFGYGEDIFAGLERGNQIYLYDLSFHLYRYKDIGDRGRIEQIVGSGEHMYFSSRDEGVMFSRPDEMAEIRSITERKGAISVAVTSHGESLAIGYEDGLIAVAKKDFRKGWDFGIRAEGNHLSSVHGLAWNASGTILASASSDRTVRLWQATTDGRIEEAPNNSSSIKHLRTLNHYAAVTSVSFSEDGQLLASLEITGAVHIFRTDDWGEVATFQIEEGDYYGTVAFSPCGLILASAAGGKSTVRLDRINPDVIFRDEPYKIEQKAPIVPERLAATEIASIQFESAIISDLSWATDGSEFAAAGGQCIIRMSSDGITSHNSPSPKKHLLTAVLHRSRDIVLGTEHGEVLRFRNERFEEIEKGPNESKHSRVEQIVSKNNRVFIANRDEGVESRDETLHQVVSLSGKKSVMCIATNPTNDVLAIGFENGKLRFTQALDNLSGRDIDDMSVLPPNESTLSTINSLSWSNDGRLIACAQNRGRLVVYRYKSNNLRHDTKLVYSLNLGDNLVSVSFSHDDKFLAVFDMSGAIGIYRTDDWSETTFIISEPGNHYGSVSFSPTELILASAAGGTDTIHLNRINAEAIFNKKPFNEELYMLQGGFFNSVESRRDIEVFTPSAEASGQMIESLETLGFHCHVDLRGEGSGIQSPLATIIVITDFKSIANETSRNLIQILQKKILESSSVFAYASTLNGNLIRTFINYGVNAVTSDIAFLGEALLGNRDKNLEHGIEPPIGVLSIRTFASDGRESSSFGVLIRNGLVVIPECQFGGKDERHLENILAQSRLGEATWLSEPEHYDGFTVYEASRSFEASVEELFSITTFGNERFLWTYKQSSGWVMERLGTLLDQRSEIQIPESQIGSKGGVILDEYHNCIGICDVSITGSHFRFIPSNEFMKDYSGFSTAMAIRNVAVKSSQFEHGEVILGQLLIFSSKSQHTWLVFSSQRVYVLLDDEETRSDNRIVQSVIENQYAFPMRFTKRDKTPTVGFWADGVNWLYSESLYPDVTSFAERISRQSGRPLEDIQEHKE